MEPTQAPTIDLDDVVEVFVNGTFEQLRDKVTNLNLDVLTYQMIVTILSVCGITVSAVLRKKILYILKVIYKKIFRITKSQVDTEVKRIEDKVTEQESHVEQIKAQMIEEVQRVMSCNDCFDYKKTYDDLKLHYESKLDELKVENLKLNNQIKNMEWRLETVMNKVFNLTKNGTINNVTPMQETVSTVFDTKIIDNYSAEKMSKY
ncbi:NSP4 [Rotavirus L]|nr:NSP4 [Rotavirus L]